MNSLLDTYKEATVSDSVAFTEFMLAYKKTANTIYCFFEGQEDFSYYPIRIKNISNADNLRNFNCGGKENVIKVRAVIKNHAHYNTVKTGFFVDKDFDKNELPEDIYVTPMYGIENLYCTKEVIESILISEFKFQKDSDDCKKALEIYENLLRSFNNNTLLFNSWLSCQADYRNANKGTTRLNIDKKAKAIFDGVVLPDLTGVSAVNEISGKAEIEVLYNMSPIVPDEALAEKVNIYTTVNQLSVFRGKFILRFLISFLSRLQSISGQADNPFSNKYSCTLRFESGTGCSALSQYAQTPTCLRTYILTYLN